MEVIENVGTEKGDRQTGPAPVRGRLAKLTAGVVVASGALVLAATPGWSFPGLGC